MSVKGERKFVGVLHDLTARVQLEEQLREQATMVRIGEMAAVLAHEVRNPLAGIRGAVEVISQRLAPASGDATTVAHILARIDTLDSMMKDVLLFARPPRLRPRVVNIEGVIAAAVALAMEDPIFHDVRLEISGGVPWILGDPEGLKVVLLNLFLNAAQAISGHGVIHVSVYSSEASCRVAVTDQGPGLSLEAREKLFTPFFTTKARGTGLGLSIAQQIVKAHQGDIRIESPEEGGTTVVVTLPLAPEGEASTST
jgi:two-component system sensor histidine kinase HydH